MRNIEDVFGIWPSVAEMARDMGAAPVTVRQWRNRGFRIPPRYWVRIQEAAARKGREIPLEIFVANAAEA